MSSLRSPGMRAVANQTYRLLELWDRLAGTRDHGAIDGVVLEGWVKEARSLAEGEARRHGRFSGSETCCLFSARSGRQLAGRSGARRDRPLSRPSPPTSSSTTFRLIAKRAVRHFIGWAIPFPSFGCGMGLGFCRGVMNPGICSWMIGPGRVQPLAVGIVPNGQIHAVRSLFATAGF